MSLLPYFQSKLLELNLLQNKWRSILNPIISIPFISGVQLTDIILIDGINVINTTLNQMQQGWFVTDITNPATIYRSSAFNTRTLTLTSSAACTVNLWVY